MDRCMDGHNGFKDDFESFSVGWIPSGKVQLMNAARHFPKGTGLASLFFSLADKLIDFYDSGRKYSCPIFEGSCMPAKRSVVSREFGLLTLFKPSPEITFGFG